MTRMRLSDLHPLPVGARVHHYAGRYSCWYFGPSDQVTDRDNGGVFWGTVLEAKGPYHDGSYEYRVQGDEPLVETDAERWWSSLSIDRILGVGATVASA
jgi:hypothetical protein